MTAPHARNSPRTMLDAPTQQSIEQIHASGFRLVYEFTGAGSLALAWLHAVAGSSRTLLEASDRYAATSLTDLLGTAPTKSVSTETAAAMAARAYRRAVRLSDGSAPGACLGLACTATIATDRTKRGEHACHVAVQDRYGVTTHALVLTKGERDRFGEETVVAQLVVRALAAACKVEPLPPIDLSEGEQVETSFTPAEDPLLQLLEGGARWVVVGRDGRLAADEPVERAALLSGSFNPLHAGHEAMARAAGRRLRVPVYFELPVVNADKPPLSESEVERRLATFRGRHAVVLTRVPLFAQKSELFPGCTFVVGYDTAARLVDPKYYADSPAARDAALHTIASRGCRFLVAARAQGDAVRTLRDIPEAAPFAGLFVELPPAEFRVDVSSTELREGART